MKKLYTENKYKRHNRKKIREGLKKRKKKYSYKAPPPKKEVVDIKEEVEAPEDFRVIENTVDCYQFFKNIRSKKYTSIYNEENFVNMTLKPVDHIDYGTISILTAISEDLKYKDILLNGDFPKNEESKKFLIESGFLNYMYDENGKRFPRPNKSRLIFFEKGSGRLSEDDNRSISRLIKESVQHLTGKERSCQSIKTMILEICGNSIEWGATDKKQWLLGLKYEKDKVIFTVTDVGLGILSTLHRKFEKVLKDTFSFKSDLEILEGAFDKKYGSSSKEENRNKGLPSIRIKNEEGKIKNLKVLTNNVILHFNNKEKSRTLNIYEPYYRGTYYEWELDRECLKNIFDQEV